MSSTKVGPGLPAEYDALKAVDVLPDTPFVEMSSGHLCVKGEGFRYKGNIIIPKSSERPSTAGRVVDCGRGCAELAGFTSLERGDRILYSQFAGYLFNFKGTAGMRVMGASEILGKLKPDVEMEDE